LAKNQRKLEKQRSRKFESDSHVKLHTTSKTQSAGSHWTHRARRIIPEGVVHRSPEPALACKSILLVDDDTIVRDCLKEVLLSEGYQIIQAKDGQQALDLLRNSAVDLVLLDLNMPVKNGWDTFEQLTTEHPLIPTIIVTARPNQLFTALSGGAGALVEKPMDIRMFLQTVKKLLAESLEHRLARLAGKETEFYYQPATANKEFGDSHEQS
jgi:CheY-like chemotaxis protein